MDTCASCHARRTELTGDLKPGDAFFDHYSLAMVDQSDLFYPDGQVREEDYEYSAPLDEEYISFSFPYFSNHSPA